jgi:hypothetical protein
MGVVARKVFSPYGDCSAVLRGCSLKIFQVEVKVNPPDYLPLYLVALGEGKTDGFRKKLSQFLLGRFTDLEQKTKTLHGQTEKGSFVFSSC